MRHRKGDVVRVTDGIATEYEVLLTEVTHKGAAGIIRARHHPRQDSVDILLGQAIPKGDKLDWVVEKAVELGVTAVHPILVERSATRMDERRAADRRGRWQRVAEAARKQCGRTRQAEIAPVAPLEAFLEAASGADLKLVFHERAVQGLRFALSGATGPSSIAVLIGPEGGFSGAEIRLAEASGFRPVSLGSRILRSETAPLAVLAILGYVFGNLGEPAEGGETTAP